MKVLLRDKRQAAEFWRDAVECVASSDVVKDFLKYRAEVIESLVCCCIYKLFSTHGVLADLPPVWDNNMAGSTANSFKLVNVTRHQIAI